MSTQRTFNIVSDRPDFPRIEESILTQWREEDTFKKSLQRSRGKPCYTFYDGPPFATGLPHYGHILAGTIKDIVTRYFQQSGYHVERRFGWDTHGLPVEYEIDQKLGIKSRSDVTDKIGIAAYNEECRSVVMRYSKEWRHCVERVGRWIDFDNDYKTLQPSFMESVWWVFNELFKKGLVYRDFKVMPYSVGCSTPLSNFEAGQNYKDVSDPSIIVTFPIIDDPHNTEILAWTTTPWTLPSNMALCVHPEFRYTRFKVKDTGRVFLVSEDRLMPVLKDMKVKGKSLEQLTETGVIEILETNILGASLVNLRYQPLFDYYASQPYWAERAFRVLSDTYVTNDTGTGIVHNSPAFGEDDFRVCQLHNVTEKGGELPCPVDDSGCFQAPVTTEGLLGVNVKEADKLIKQLLKEKNRLVVNDTFVHSYPFCWRSDTPLLYKAVPSWFVRVESLKETLLKNNTETRWVPKVVQEKRFHNWLADARDWCVSRNRFWGTPIPLWISADETQVRCIGSIAELQQYTDKPIQDLHRHMIDDILIPDPRGDQYPPMRRVEEVFDCWFESGSMPYAKDHYPFENKEQFEAGFPADFVAEGLDQTRGWFYTLSVLGAALFGKAPFKNLVVNGLVLAADGKKMSKRLRNYPPPLELVDRQGADALRLFLVSSPVVKAESVRFKEESVKEIIKNISLPWYHSLRFLTQEVTRYEMGGTKWRFDLESSDLNLMDHWIISLTNSLIKFYHEEMTSYRLYTALPKLLIFLDQLTNWYVRLNRDRMRGNDKSEDSRRALAVLFTVLLNFTRLMSPFTPFFAEHVYKNLVSAFPEGHPDKLDSVHYTDLPQPDASKIQPEIEEKVALLQDVVVLGRQMRDKRRIQIKTPVKSMTVICDNPHKIQILETVKTYLQDELNALEVVLLCEQDRINVSACPNLKVLGSRLGPKLKDLIPKIRALSHEQLKKAEADGSIVVDDITVQLDELLLTKSARGLEETETQAVECNSELVLICDLEKTPDLIERALVRQVVTIIQKMRKEEGLQMDDQVITVVKPKSDEMRTACTSRKALIEEILRRPVVIDSMPTTQLKCERSHDDVDVLFFECQ
eukprot:Blabericola_migrator_1__6603@NODE_332_length_9696_cov_191_326202_g268_i0_p1_GENE_NODE_332_length_9696_cov_191_326202_g268_i0NODE_332_length_9696_cov_191_326202_g268_i0_p1_ORF_typecomplete_len1086_score270_09tRNAsynt_1/PF00133_22/3_3e160Anticodon_1/PF08264_13/5e34Anticodon_1/PF08264_13/71tRNAsynt_1g/PF09334_11/5_4e15tRNAsynt_1g/PF09334_11/4e12tRNAsynt_1e/PF01406_19/6_2tRNAsynt_1e/PF01406_19/0_044tRNAsynt_1d/PF00750_19/5tRNAsynt_1d/PF00750_19/8_6tRNAsynt_1f/PF01921_18/12tRNAsynt_1f/PF01921_18/2DUF